MRTIIQQLKLNYVILLLVIILHYHYSSVRGSPDEYLSCVNEDGKAIDWFIAYKFPEIRESGDNQVKSGYAYSYITSEEAGHTKRNRISRINRSNEERTTNRNSKKSITLRSLYRMIIMGHPQIDDTNSSSVENRRLPSTYEPTSKKRYEDGAKWKLSNRLITDDDSLIIKNIRPAFGRKGTSLNLIFYNDQPPAGGPSGNDDCAHSKGILLMDERSGTGLWLTHSTPRFPPQHLNKPEFEKNVAVNGQTFMCITFDVAKMGDEIVKHLVVMRPQIYDSVLSDNILNQVPELRNLTISGRGRGPFKRRGRSSVKNPGGEHLHQAIRTLAGQQLDLFSKSKDFHFDIYADWIANELDSDLFVETWQNGAGIPLNSSCPLRGHRVNNVRNLRANLEISNEGKTEEIDWQYSHDHSKWAISQKQEQSRVCVGDINRMHSQFRRGGGIMCFRNTKGWKLFRDTIKDFESC